MGIINGQFGNKCGFIFRVFVNAFDIGQERQLLRIDRFGDGAGRIVRINIVSIKRFIQADRTNNRKKILFQ